MVLHFQTPLEDTQPKGWLCPFCRTVNNQNTEVCKTCNHRKDLAPPAYHHLTPPPNFKDIHSNNNHASNVLGSHSRNNSFNNSGTTTIIAPSHSSSTLTEHASSSFTSSSSPYVIKRSASPPSHGSSCVTYSSADSSAHIPSTTAAASSFHHSSPLSFTRSTPHISSALTSTPASVLNFSPPRHSDGEEGYNNDAHTHDQQEGSVGVFKRQMSALSSFDSFFEEEEEGRQSYMTPTASDMYSNNNNNKYDSPDREPVAIFEQLSSGSMQSSLPSISERPVFGQLGNGSPRDGAPALWTCSQCAYINDRGKTICDVCNQPKPKAAAAYREY